MRVKLTDEHIGKANRIHTKPPLQEINANSSVTILHYNIQGCKNKLLELEIYIQNSKLYPDILLLTEHWLREDNIDLLRTLPGYKLAAHYGRESMDRGGSGILIRDHIECVNRLDIAKWAEPMNFEIACTEVVLAKQDLTNIIIIAIYRTPTSNLEVLFEKLESILHKLHREAIDKKNKILLVVILM